jgi:lactate permease
MFQQLLTPVGNSLPASFAVAALPIVAVLVLLGIFRRPAWQASLAGLVVALVVAIGVWDFPPALAAAAVANGAIFALWPVMWIVVAALLLYNIAVSTGRFDAFRDWVMDHLPNDRRVVLVVIGFCFGALLEGVAGFGTPVAITSSLLIMVGFPPLEALVFTLIFNTAPVAFGALGVPITTLGNVTHLSPVVLGKMVGRQLPFLAFLLPFYVMTIYGGFRSLVAMLPLLLVAGGSFALSQFVCSNYIDYQLTDVLSSLGALIVTLLFLQVWRPAPDEGHAVRITGAAIAARTHGIPTWQGWIPWLVITVVVILWTNYKVFAIAAQVIHFPGLDKQVSITLYQGVPYAAVYTFQPLATGTAILLAAIITAALCGCGPAMFVRNVALTFRQTWLAILPVALIISLAYLMNYSGISYTLGEGVAAAGPFFIILSPFLGWVAVFLSGSDTSGNALFGNLQVVAAHQLNLSPVLAAATNSSGGVLGKMISPQNIATGVSVTNLKGQEGAVFARTFLHSLALTVLLGLLVAAEQFLFPWIIPL